MNARKLFLQGPRRQQGRSALGSPFSCTRPSCRPCATRPILGGTHPQDRSSLSRTALDLQHPRGSEGTCQHHPLVPRGPQLLPSIRRLPQQAGSVHCPASGAWAPPGRSGTRNSPANRAAPCQPPAATPEPDPLLQVSLLHGERESQPSVLSSVQEQQPRDAASPTPTGQLLSSPLQVTVWGPEAWGRLPARAADGITACAHPLQLRSDGARGAAPPRGG